MNMLRDEDNAKYRSVIKNTLEFDPDIMKRYVNFMTNPDERTAIDQFGTGDKYFGVAAMMSTLPGLPMFGHGQIEGYTEKYGMEYQLAALRRDARPMARRAPRARDRPAAQAPLALRRELQLPALRLLPRLRLTSTKTSSPTPTASTTSAPSSSTTTSTAPPAAPSTSPPPMRQGLRPTAPAPPLGRPRPQSTRAPSSPTATPSPASSTSAAPPTSTTTACRFDLHAYQCHVFLDWRELRATAERPWDRLCD